MLAPLAFLSFAGQYGLMTGWKHADFGPVKKWYCKNGIKSAKTATLDTNTSIVQVFATCESRKVSSSGIIGQADALTNIYVGSTGPNMLPISILVIGALLVIVEGFLFVKLIRENAG